MRERDDDFAKIFRTQSGRQVLIYCDADGEFDNPQIVTATKVGGATIKISSGYEDDDDGYERRSKGFSNFDAAAAERFEAMVIGMISGDSDTKEPA